MASRLASSAGRLPWMSVMTATRTGGQGSAFAASAQSVFIYAMATELELAPKRKRAPGEPCCEPVVYPDVDRQEAERMAAIAKALGDPIRLTLVDVLRKHAGKVCVVELVPLFHLSQPTVSHHLKVLRD